MAAFTLDNLPEGQLNATAKREHTQARLFPVDANAQVAAWREVAGRWESDADLAQETAGIVGRRTRGRQVEF